MLAPSLPPAASALLDTAPEVVRPLAMRGELNRYRKGTVLIEEGSQGDTLFIVVAGSLRAFASGERGREITYGTYGAGDCVGEMSLDGGPRSATVVTLETTDCVIVGRHTVRQHIAEHPEFAFELMSQVIRRARAATLTARQLALNDVYGRLATTLNALAMPQPDGVRMTETRLTHRDLAHRVGCSREMVSRLLKDLNTGGYIDSARGRLRLLRNLRSRW